MTDKKTDDPLIGKIIVQKYEILECLGKGGFGSVYKAKNLSIGIYVAIKVLHPDYIEDKKIAARFQHEAEIAGHIPNPHIAKAFDKGVCSETGIVFIVMEYVEGCPLRGLIESKRGLDLDRSLHIILQLCDGIAAAHKINILHRDIKPSNILLKDYHGDPDFVKITDFGIAKVLEESNELKKLTNTGIEGVAGTCLYMAPEQFQDNYVAHFTSDVYALGCVFFEMLTGEPPYNGGSNVVTANLHANAKIPELKLKSVEPVIQSHLNAIISKALAKQPSMRYQSVNELYADLKKIEVRLAKQSGPGIFNAIEQTWMLFLRFVRASYLWCKGLNPYVIGGGAFLLVLVCAGVFYFIENNFAQEFVLPPQQRQIDWMPPPPAETAKDQRLFEEKERKLQEILTSYRTFGKLSTAEALPILMKSGYFYLDSASLFKACVSRRKWPGKPDETVRPAKRYLLNSRNEVTLAL